MSTTSALGKEATQSQHFAKKYSYFAKKKKNFCSNKQKMCRSLCKITKKPELAYFLLQFFTDKKSEFF
jgi:hypothetical protein